jgi:hypothetical protein
MRTLRMTHVVGIALTIGLAVPAHADPEQDQHFYELLDPSILNMSYFEMYKMQAMTACMRMDGGQPDLDLIHDMQRMYGYSFDQASEIKSAGKVIYCPWNLGRPLSPPPPPPPG